MRSTKRPSRGLRDSAMTMRKCGRFLEPPRESLIFSDMWFPSYDPYKDETQLPFAAEARRQAGRQTAAAKPREHLRIHAAAERTHHAAAAFAHLLHHVGHLTLHLADLVDVGDFDAGARRDAFAARAVDEVGIGALLLRHRGDDRFLALEHAVIETCGGELILHLADARQHAEKPLHTAHLAHLGELIGEIVEVELALFHFLGELLGLLAVDMLDRLLDEGDDVAHVEDARGDSLRMERFERVELFAGAEELDRDRKSV